MNVVRMRKLSLFALVLGVLFACGGRPANAQWPYYGPFNQPVPRPYNPYLPYSPGQQRGWQDAKIYEVTGMLPRFMSPNEARTFENKIIRDGLAPVPMYPVYPFRPALPYQPGLPGYKRTMPF